VATIDSVKIDAFARLMTDKLDNGDTNARKGYIRSIVDAIEVDDRAVRIIGSKDILRAVIAGKQNTNGNVRGFVRGHFWSRFLTRNVGGRRRLANGILFSMPQTKSSE